MTDDELKHLLETNAAEMRHHFDETAVQMGRRLDETTVEMRRHFDITVEHFDKKLDTLAELMASRFEILERKTDDIEERMKTGFAETQAMIKFSHAELDRRVRSLEQSQRALEEGVASLLARVERLEASTH